LLLLYLAGLLLLADQAADLTATLLANSPAPGAASWRFGAFGLMASRVSVLLLADLMLFLAAVGLEHRKALKLLGVLHLLLVPVLAAGVVLFALDWLEVRARVSEAGPGRFDFAGVRAIMLALLATVLCGWAGWMALRAGRSHPHQRGRDAEPAPLLTGTSARGKGKP
jgi:hypothetical protein